MGIIEKMRLDGKSIFVPGGARGIGKSVATAFCEAGANVAIVDVDIATAQETAQWLRETTGSDTMAIRADVTNPEDVDAMVAAVLAKYGKLDAAFCNAGICMNIPAEEMTLAQWKKVIDINLTGVFLTAQAAGKVMLKQGYGSIINTAGVIQLTKSLAIEWAKRGVRVNSISPGYIGTDLTLSSETLKPLIEKWNAMAPMGRLGRPEELQSVCVYLAGDTSSFTTGSDFIVDGAFTCF